MDRRMVTFLTSLVCFYSYCRETITLTFRDKQVTEILLMKSYYTRYYAQTPAGGRTYRKSRPVLSARAQHHKALKLHGKAPSNA